MYSAKRIFVVVIVIVLMAIGTYWLISSRPKKPTAPPLVTVGVGLYLGRNQETHKFEIKRIFPNSPADKAGLTPGMVLNKVDGILAEAKNIKDLSALLSGPVGTKVVVETIDGNGATNQIELLREQFVNHSKQ